MEERGGCGGGNAPALAMATLWCCVASSLVGGGMRSMPFLLRSASRRYISQGTWAATSLRVGLRFSLQATLHTPLPLPSI